MPTTSRAKGKFELDGVKFRCRWTVSSNVDWVAWPESGEPLMLVMFSNGGLYSYQGVTRQRAVAAAYAKSTGEYINQVIKPQFEANRIRSDS